MFELWRLLVALFVAKSQNLIWAATQHKSNQMWREKSFRIRCFRLFDFEGVFFVSSHEPYQFKRAHHVLLACRWKAEIFKRTQPFCQRSISSACLWIFNDHLRPSIRFVVIGISLRSGFWLLNHRKKISPEASPEKFQPTTQEDRKNKNSDDKHRLLRVCSSSIILL